VRTYYDPLHEMTAFAECSRADELSVTRELGARMLSLPMAVDLDDAEISAVVEMVHAGAHAVVRSV
jgi:dTDP-4-amino-4,6-dideoxygalactose transaminase